MLLVDHYLYLPGCCYMCRGVATPTIDTGIDLDHPNSPDDPNPSANRRFYICPDCAVEMARMVLHVRNLDLVGSGTNQTLADMVETTTAKNMELQQRVEELENALRIVKTISPEAPESSPNKKNFKVVSPKDLEV